MTRRRNPFARPRIKLLHRFRSDVVDMQKMDDGKRILVFLASGKAYISNSALTRWYKVWPEKANPVLVRR